MNILSRISIVLLICALCVCPVVAKDKTKDDEKRNPFQEDLVACVGGAAVGAAVGAAGGGIFGGGIGAAGGCLSAIVDKHSEDISNTITKANEGHKKNKGEKK